MKQAMKVLSLALVLLSISSVGFAQTLTHRTLQFTTFLETNNPGDGGCQINCTIAFSCSTAGCTASGRLFPAWNVTCPASAGHTCTFVLLPTIAFLSSGGDLPFVSLKIDRSKGPAYFPVPGACGTITDFGCGVQNLVNVATTLLVIVKNTTANQVHPVEVDYGCTDQDGDGCNVAAIDASGARAQFIGTLKIDVYTP